MSAQPKRHANGRYQPGGPSPNPNGRPRKSTSIDDAVLDALSDKIAVTENGKRTRRSKLRIAAGQLANKSASGDLRATRLMLTEARKAEERKAGQAASIPVLSETDQEIAERVIARLTALILKDRSDDRPEA